MEESEWREGEKTEEKRQRFELGNKIEAKRPWGRDRGEET